jgi:hypothetical protein
VELFRELVNVRYKRAKDLQIPLFRTLQWTWFFVAMFFTCTCPRYTTMLTFVSTHTWELTNCVCYADGDFLHSFCLEHKDFAWLAQFTQYHSYATFAMYSMLFVTTVLTLKPGLVKFQLNQMMWTIVTLCLIVGQCKYVVMYAYMCTSRSSISVHPSFNPSMHTPVCQARVDPYPNTLYTRVCMKNFVTELVQRFIAYNIFDGLYWFFFPVSVVSASQHSALVCMYLHICKTNSMFVLIQRTFRLL